MTLVFHRLLRANFSTIRTEGKRASGELLGIEDLLQTTVRDTTTANCPYRFQSFSCGVVVAGTLGVITTIGSNQVYTIEFPAIPAFPSERYVQGTARILHGIAAGEELDIQGMGPTGATSQTLTFLSPLLLPLQLGTPLIVYPGCTKTLESCNAYGNLNRGRHLPRIKGSKVYTNAEGIEVVTE